MKQMSVFIYSSNLRDWQAAGKYVGNHTPCGKGEKDPNYERIPAFV
jgi:hypothetical protein